MAINKRNKQSPSKSQLPPCWPGASNFESIAGPNKMALSPLHHRHSFHLHKVHRPNVVGPPRQPPYRERDSAQDNSNNGQNKRTLATIFKGRISEKADKILHRPTSARQIFEMVSGRSSCVPPGLQLRLYRNITDYSELCTKIEHNISIFHWSTWRGLLYRPFLFLLKRVSIWSGTGGKVFVPLGGYDRNPIQNR